MVVFRRWIIPPPLSYAPSIPQRKPIIQIRISPIVLSPFRVDGMGGGLAPPLQDAAKEQHGGKVNSLLNALITAELERQKLIPSEPPQDTAGRFQDIGTPSGAEPLAVAPSPTQPPEKQPSEYTYADFEAMDDEAFQRFVTMSTFDFNQYINKGFTTVEVTGFSEKITPIRFRTTVLTDIYEETKDIKAAQNATGHTTSAMTMKYYVKGRGTADRTAEAIDRVYGS